MKTRRSKMPKVLTDVLKILLPLLPFVVLFFVLLERYR